MARMNEAMHDLFKYDASMLPRKRSTFNRSHSKATTFDSGYLIPILIDDILPGDEVKLSTDALVRMATPIHPTMDTAYVDIFAFYCPYRVVWDNAKAFYGENLDAEYNQLDEYEIPSFQYLSIMGSAQSPENLPIWEVGSLLDYMEYPDLPNTYEKSREVSVLPFRVYQKIWNDWFRSSEIQSSVPINYGDSVTDEEINSVFTLRKVGKLHDRFTSLLPSPQAGPSVTLPLGTVAPVLTSSGTVKQSDYSIMFRGQSTNGQSSSLKMFGLPSTDVTEVVVHPSGTSSDMLRPNNLYADLSQASGASINDLRVAISTQQALEQIQRGGTRYNSIIFSMFGVATPDDVLQRPVLLGTHRQVVGMRTVAQTAQTETGIPGELGAFSATRIGNGFLFDKAFTEPGYLMVLCAVRPLHSYSQGYPDHAKKLSRFDHYFPVFDNIGNQPVYADSLIAVDPDTGFPVSKDRVLGYQSAWTEYRVKENKVTGLMRPDVDGSLGRSWTYTDYFSSVPILNYDFIAENPELIDRTIAVPSQPQFIGDFYFDMIHTRPMGITSIPGLMRL